VSEVVNTGASWKIQLNDQKWTAMRTVSTINVATCCQRYRLQDGISHDVHLPHPTISFAVLRVQLKSFLAVVYRFLMFTHLAVCSRPAA